jgi:hypothetical protein
MVVSFLIFFVLFAMLYVLSVPVVQAEPQNGVPAALAASERVDAIADAADMGPMSVLSPEGKAASEARIGMVSREGILAWAPTAPYPLADGIVRYAHAQCSDQPNSFYVISGVSGSVIANMYRYDADTNSWMPLASIPVGSEGPSATCYQGRIYVAGGSGSTNFFTYDIATNTWTAGPSLPRGVWGAAMGSYANRIFVVGGDSDFSFGGTSNEVNIFDIELNEWRRAGSSMPAAAVAAGYAQVGRYLFVVGGWNDSSPAQNVTAAQRYDMATNTWATGPAFASARSDFALAATSRRLYAMGGDSNGGGAFDATALIEYLDYTSWPSGAWTDALDPLPQALTGHGGGFCTNAVSGGEVWSTGGLTAGFAFSDANQYKAAELCYREASPDGLKILYYVDKEYPGHDTFYEALASMSLLPSTTVVRGDNAMAGYLANESWHLIVTLIQDRGGDKIFTNTLINYVTQGGKAILADWRGHSNADAVALAAAFQGSYTGSYNGSNIYFVPGSMLWYGLTSPIYLGLPSGVSWGTYSMGLGATGNAVEAGIFPNGDAAIVIGNSGNTILNGFLQDVFLDFGEGVYLTANEVRYLLYNLNVAKIGSGGGTVTAKKTPINCGTTCGADFSTGQVVKLSAKAAKGSKFAGWSGACSGTKKTCVVQVGGPGSYKGVTAIFNLK